MDISQTNFDTKKEIVNELGVSNNQMIDKGNLTSRQNGTYAGYVGGLMTRKLVEMGEKQLMEENKKL